MSDDTAMQPFDFKGNPVRVVMIDDEPWFVALDVCEALGIARARDAVSRLGPDDAVLTGVIDSVGREQRSHVVSESGLYELVIRSDKPDAKAFRRWITAEVLPSIRKTGGYLGVKLDPALQRIVDLTVEMQLTKNEQERQAREIATLAEATFDHDARLQAIEGHHGWYAALGYARLNGLPTSETWLQRLGMAASKIGKAAGLVAQKVPHAHYGSANSWPTWVWDTAVEIRRAAGEDML